MPAGALLSAAPRCAIVFVGLLLAAAPLDAEFVSVSVFGLFRPQELIVSAAIGGRLNIVNGGEPLAVEGGQRLRLSSRGTSLSASIGGADFLANLVSVKPSGAAGRFLLEAPGKIRREFDGELTVQVRGGALEAIVEMNLEAAVAAIVAAEGGGASPEALAAQAVAVRSYLTAATGRHSGFQFCDTTHCQYLADPPSDSAPASQAASRTRGLVLAYRGARFAPLYSRSCGGTTQTPADVGLSGGSFPYRRVRCPICSRERTSWAASRLASDLSAILSRPGNENARLETVRKLGWSAVPSNRYEVRREGDRVRLEGAGEGHGIGLCQRGAIGLAGEGWSFREILSYYFPDVAFIELRAR